MATAVVAADGEMSVLKALAGTMGPVRSAVDMMMDVGMVDVMRAFGRISKITLAQSYRSAGIWYQHPQYR